MEYFWTDTPFGITLFASVVPTMLASMFVAVRLVARARAGDVPQDRATTLVGFFLVYAALMVVVTYGALVAYYLSSVLLNVFGVYQIAGETFGPLLWLVVQSAVGGLWLGTAAWLCRRMFDRWV